VSYELDPELVSVMAALAEQAAAAPAPARGDWKTLRRAGELGQACLATLVPPSSGVQTATFHATSDDASIELRWYTKPSQAGAGPTSQPGAEPGPAVVYAHGGGMVLGTLDLYDEVVSWYVDQTGVPFLSVGYRRRPAVRLVGHGRAGPRGPGTPSAAPGSTPTRRSPACLSSRSPPQRPTPNVSWPKSAPGTAPRPSSSPIKAAS